MLLHQNKISTFYALHNASYPLLWQLGIAIAASFVIAALSWYLFGMNMVFKKMSGTLSRKFA